MSKFIIVGDDNTDTHDTCCNTYMLAKTNLKSKDQYYRIEKGAFGKTYKKGK